MSKESAYALIVAIDEYPSGFYSSTEKPLKCAVEDGNWVKTWLENNYGSEKTHVHFL